MHYFKYVLMHMESGQDSKLRWALSFMYRNSRRDCDIKLFDRRIF